MTPNQTAGQTQASVTATEEAKSLRIIFAGTPEFAAAHLQTLIDQEFNLVGVYTQPDRPANRGKKLTPSAVKVVAEQNNLPVLQPINFKSEESLKELNDLNADLMIVVAYGLLLPQTVLDAPKQGCINVHASLLPRWRGAAPIQRAIEAGDAATGITIMQMDIGLDTGDMLVKETLAIQSRETGGSLHDRLIEAGQPALITALNQIAEHSLQPESQDDELATYAHKLSKQEAQVNWSLPASEIERKIRAFNPFPVCFTFLGDERIRIWDGMRVDKPHGALPGTVLAVDATGILVAAGKGAVLITQLQLAGKKAMSVQELINAKPQMFQPMYMLSSES